MTEICFTFPCEGHELVGIAHLPETPAPYPAGVLILVGGPQYRVGAHRQYVHLARYLASQGIPAMRFDFRGIGDSDGAYPGFQALEPDMTAAVKAFYAHVPGLQSIIPWGLCEGASTILLCATHQPGVTGAVLLNPWVRSEATLAKAHLKHYYARRFLTPEFWKKIFGGKADMKDMIVSFASTLKNVIRPKPAASEQTQAPFPDRMAAGLAAFKGKVLLIQSENDFVAREFDERSKSDTCWNVLKRPDIERFDLKQADHTFSTEAWRQAVAVKVAQWVKSLPRVQA